MSALIQSFSSLSLSSRSLRGDARVASPSAMPMRKRTAVVTEAVRCFSPLFLGKNWSKFSLLSRFLRVTKRCCFPTLSRTRCERFFARKKPRPKCVCYFLREREQTARVFVVSRQSRFVAENVFCSSLFLAILSEGLLQVLEKQNPPLLCFSKRNSR